MTAQQLEVRAARWSTLNHDALVSQTTSSDRVSLSYRSGSGIRSRLSELVALENDCCGAASVVFELDSENNVVHVKATADNTPSRTVLAAFSRMVEERD